METCLISLLLNLLCELAVHAEQELADRTAIEPSRTALAASDNLYGHREAVERGVDRFSEDEDIEEPSPIKAFSTRSSSWYFATGVYLFCLRPLKENMLTL